MVNDITVSYLDGPMGVTEKIRKSMYKVASEFCYIGFLLWECQQYGYYREHGHQNVYDYAALELGFKRTTVKNLIAINETFGTCNRRQLGSGSVVSDRTMSLQDGYEKFNYSQLVEMLSMSERQRKSVSPDMTIKQIRSLKKSDVSSPSILEVPESELVQTELVLTGQTSDQSLESFSVDFSRDDIEFWIDYLIDEISLSRKIDFEYETTPEFLYFQDLLNKLSVFVKR